MKGVSIFLAEGFEDVEAFGTCDVLRRGGVKVNLVGIKDEPFVVSSKGVVFGVENFLSDIPDSQSGTNAGDWMIFPGGLPGAVNLAGCGRLVSLMKEHFKSGGSLAAICAAPSLVLGQLDAGVLSGLEFTCFDGFEPEVQAKGAVFRPEPFVHSGRIITGRSAGHTLHFALEILRTIKGDEVAATVSHGLFLD